MRLAIAAVLIAGGTTFAAGEAAAAPVLERVIMLSRHGVRAPTRTADVLASLTRRKWPVWPGGAGEMTPHGAKALGFMADFLRATYVHEGLLPPQGCPAADAVQVWADSLDRRTRQSGDVFAERLAPGCGATSRFASGKALDPVFDASKTDACPVGMLARGGALLAAAREKGGLLRPEDRQALAALQTILAPDACTAGGEGLCLVPEKDASTARIGTSLTVGAIAAEGLYLAYAEGMPLAEVGWGRIAGDDTIRAIMPVHERGIGILRGTPLLAARRGIVLTRTILALLNGAALPPGAPPLAADAKLVMLAGHDSNLLYAAALMGLDWRLPGQPTMTPPDATLAFELWHDAASGQRTLRVVVYAQTLAQLRDATPIDAAHPPDVVTVRPEACAADAPCRLEAFSSAVEARLTDLCAG